MKPIAGAKKEGAGGFLKGFGQGLGGYRFAHIHILTLFIQVFLFTSWCSSEACDWCWGRIVKCNAWHF